MASSQNSGQKELKGAPTLSVNRSLQRLMDNYHLNTAQISQKIEQMDIPILAGYFDTVEFYVDLMGLTEGEQNDVKRKECSGSTHLAMIECLKIWKRTRPGEACFQTLLEMLLKLNKENIATQVCQYFTGEYGGGLVVTDQLKIETNSTAVIDPPAAELSYESPTSTPHLEHFGTTQSNNKIELNDDSVIRQCLSMKEQVQELQDTCNLLARNTFDYLDENSVSISKFEGRIASMDIDLPQRTTDYLDECFGKIDANAHIARLWRKLSVLWDFLNFEFLEHVIKMLIPEDHLIQINLKAYSAKLDQFTHATKVCEFFKQWPLRLKRPDEANLKSLVVKMNLEWGNCTLSDVVNISYSLADSFSLPRPFLLLRNVEEGCVAILWYIPPSLTCSLQRQLKRGKEHFLADNGFLSITIDGDHFFSITPMKQCSLEMRNKYSRFSSKAEAAKHNSLIPFKLALIKRGEVSIFDEFTRNSLRGDKDDIHHKKSPTTINTLGYLPNGSPARLVLVEGAPGVGKTTFSRQICLKWANKELLEHIIVLFVVPLRDFNLQNISTLQELFGVIKPGKSLVEELEANKGEGLAFWLDGWDEIASTLIGRSSIYEHLVSGKVLPNSLLIVSSRPWATADIKKQLDRQPSQHIEIVSSVQHQIDWLVEQKELQSPGSKASTIVHRFVKYLDQTPAIKGNMHTPLATDITFKVYQWCQESNSPLPTTATELYNCYTVLCIHRYLDNHPRFGPLKLWKSNDLKDFPEPIRTWFISICELANDGLRDGQRLVFPDVPSQLKLESLGLMEPQDPLYASEESAVVSYHYKHLTLQEFLAAKLLSWLSEEEQSEFVQRCVSDGRFTMVLRFLSGLSKSSSFLRDYMRRMLDLHEDMLTIFHWLFEGGDKAAVTSILGEREMMVRSDYTWSSLDYYVIGHCIAQSNCSWDINFHASYMGDEKMIQFFQALSSADREQGNVYITLLDLASNDLVSHSLFYLQTVPAHFLCHLKTLCLSQNKLDSTALNHIAKSVPNMPQLETIDLSYNPNIQRGGAVSLLSALCHHKALKKLDMSGTNIAEGDCEQLAEILSSSHCLEQLNVSGNILSSDSLLSLFGGVQRNNSLIKLVVNSFSSHQCSIPLEAVNILSTYLQNKERCKLEELVLCKSNITAEKTTLLAQGLSQNCSLKELDLYANPLKGNGAIALSQAMTENKTITKLYTSECDITSTGGAALASSLMANSKLEELDISGNDDSLRYQHPS